MRTWDRPPRAPRSMPSGKKSDAAPPRPEPTQGSGRLRRIPLYAASAATLLLLVGFVIWIPAGTAGVRSWRGGGTPALVGPGLVLRFPVLQRVERFPEGIVSATGTVAAPSREGTTIDLPYTVGVRPRPADLLTLSGETAGDARGALAALVDSALREYSAATGTQELAIGAARDRLESRLSERLRERFPGADIKIRLGTPDVPATVRASFAREAVYGRRVDTGLRVLLVGIDGADWDVIDPLIRAGQLPQLARLRREGAWARLRSSVPTLSPLLWTTVATGKSPDRHGINDFLVLDTTTGRRVPINSTFRRVRAFWNILSEAGVPVDVIAWWASWPAEPVRGHLISDRVAYSTFNMSSDEARTGAVYPPEYAATVERLKVPESAVAWSRVKRFIDVDAAEFAAARAAGSGHPPSETQQSINVFTRVLASTETYRRVALDLLHRGDPRAQLFAVYFQGVDEVNHRFAHCAPPRAALCSDADYRKFHRAVDEFYRYQDEILGELIAAAPGATVVVLSDHGFASGAGRPDDVKPFIEGKPGLWHDIVGIFAASGPGIARGEIPTVTLYDMAPTVLHLVGLPVADDMPGKVLERALAPEFLAAHPVQKVPSFEGLGGEEPGQGDLRRAAEPLASGAEDEIVAQLKSLGYIGGASGGEDSAPAGPQALPGGAPAVDAPPAAGGSAGAPPAGAVGGVPTLLYHTNLAAVHLARRRVDLAEAEFGKALALDPRAPEALTGMAVVHEMKGEPEKALEILRGLVVADPVYAPARLEKIAELYVRMGRAADGVRYFEGLRGPSAPSFEGGRLVALAVVQSAAGQAREAEASLRSALKLAPDSVPALQELFTLLDAQNRAGELEAPLREAIRRAPQAGMLHNWLGLVLKRRGDLHGAEIEFRKGLEVAPDLAGVMANLGGLYLQEGRASEAVAILERALDGDPRNVQARTNLIVALGLEHDLEGARARADESEKQGQMAPTIYNALAYALHVNGRDAEALEALDKALALDPRSADTLRLRREIESSAGPPTGYR